MKISWSHHGYQLKGSTGRVGSHRWTAEKPGTLVRFDLQIWELTGNSAKKIFRLAAYPHFDQYGATVPQVKFEGVIPADIKAEFSYLYE
jgi:hypothetical protein